MTKAKKAALIIILVGICLPTATLPFITEFKPVPELCLTSNFFQNMGNMLVVFGTDKPSMTNGGTSATVSPPSIPYRYLFSLVVILVCTGLGIIVAMSGGSSAGKQS